MRKASIAIVGGGIAGVSAARRLAERGHRVTVFEQFPSGHERGSSHGRSRIVRRAYSDSFYTECMKEAYPLWAELERASGEKLLHEVGLLYFGGEQVETVQATEQGLIEFQVPYRRMSASSVREVFPQLKLEPSEIGLFTPEAGWVSADRALFVTTKLARNAGATFEQKKVDADDLKTYDKILVTAGAWINDWWSNAPVEITLQTFTYIETQVSGPVWIEDSDDLLYGFPSDEIGAKVGVHRLGREIDPDSEDREPDENDLAIIREFAKRRFGLEDPTLSHSKGCLYTTTETEDFLLTQLDEKTTLASACSGHGFKFGPWFGRLLADIAEERVDVACYSRFFA